MPETVQSACYSLNVCVPPNSHVEIITPKGDGVNIGAFGGGVKSGRWDLHERN